MSFEALAWASKCQTGSASTKLVLLGLADRHNPESGIAYPSIAWLCEWSCLNRKTVISCLDRLEADNFISDSGIRAGKTKQVKCYALALEAVPKEERFQKRNSSVFSRKESQKRDTEPIKEPISSEAKASSEARASRLPEDFIMPVEWIAWAMSERSWPRKDAKAESENFSDYWQSKAGKDARKISWEKTWRQWVRNSRRKPTHDEQEVWLP